MTSPVGRFTPLVLAAALALAPAPTAGADKDPVYVGFVPARQEVVLAYRAGSPLVLGYPDLEVVRQLRPAAPAAVAGVALSGNGRWLAADFEGESVRVWDSQSGELALEIPRARPETAPVFLFHPQDDQLLLFQEDELQRWKVDEGRRGETVRAVGRVHKMSVSPDGRYLAVWGSCALGGRDYSLCVYLLEEDLVLSAADAARYFGRHAGAIEDLAYTADHRILIRGPMQRGLMMRPLASLFLSPAELREMEHGPWDVNEAIPAIRSAPHRQLTDVSADGAWQVRALPGDQALRLLALAPGANPGTFETVREVPLP